MEKPLPLDGFQGTPDEVEQQWYDQVYLGSGDRMKQLTWRAVIVGMLLGSILSLTNLYANLKMGWSFGVALTAGIISFALWNAFVRLGISKSPMTILENTCMQSAASSAGYSTGGTLTSAVAALLLLTGQHMPLGTTFAWIFFIAVLGVTMAIPMKRQMINIEQIRFPDSIATAETLKVLYSEGKRRRDRPKPFFILPFSPPLMPSPWLQEENDGLERSSNISSATGTSVLSSSNGISCSWVRELW
ncbi:OPT/YSL family transporter [Akkermansia muciniphila]|nr:OPT/YSL family transporter [Akkermansia muciniphila]